MRRPSCLLSILIHIGQTAHVSPLFFFYLGYFFSHPSLSIIPLIIIGEVNSGAIGFIGGHIYSIQNSFRVYYDFLLHFSGCKATEQFIADLGSPNIAAGKHVIKVFHIDKNKDKNAPTPSSLCSYISDDYSPSYLFLTQPISRMTSVIQKFKLWHEIGHINQGAKDLETIINILGLGWKSFFSILLCVFMNLDIFTLGADKSKVLIALIAIILITFGILIRAINKDKWKIEELEADRFALIQIGKANSDEWFEIYEKISNKNLLYDNNANENENSFRQYVFLKRIAELDFSLPVRSQQEMTAAAINSIAAIALMFIGTMGKNLSLLDIFLNFTILIVLPLLATGCLYFFRTRGLSPALEKAIKGMEKGDYAEKTPWLDVVVPWVKFLNGDGARAFKKMLRKVFKNTNKEINPSTELIPAINMSKEIKSSSELMSVIKLIKDKDVQSARQSMWNYLQTLNETELRYFSKFIFNACDSMTNANIDIIDSGTAVSTLILRDEYLYSIDRSDLIFPERVFLK